MSTPNSNEAGENSEFSVDVEHLEFSYDSSRPPVLNDVTLQIPRGSRVVITGTNGAGKSTFLRVLGGHHQATSLKSQVRILGKDAFRDTRLNKERQYMDANWGLRTVAFAGTGVAYSANMQVGSMMKSLQDEYPERRKTLIDVLGINPEWWWNALSDGQRRRVQLFVGLLVPYEVLLLDEVTALLDVVCRHDLLNYLKAESETRGCTVLIATHVFDGIEGWPTHICYLKAYPVPGSLGYFGTVPEEIATVRGGLLDTVEKWLREEQAQAKADGVKRIEMEAGEDARMARNTSSKSTSSAGGYAPGRSDMLSQRGMNLYQ